MRRSSPRNEMVRGVSTSRVRTVRAPGCRAMDMAAFMGRKGVRMRHDSPGNPGARSNEKKSVPVQEKLVKPLHEDFSGTAQILFACSRLWPFLDCPERSEEHTSELQSLMRNSYAV